MQQAPPDTGSAGPRSISEVFPRSSTERPFLLELYRSAMGKKTVMAVTGIIMLSYVLVHMIGNLHLYEGPAQVNEYGEGLRELGGDLVPRTLLLWVMRVGLIVVFALHIHAAVVLTRVNRLARPQDYESERDWIAVNFASRTMIWSGLIVVLFLAWHLADLTWGVESVSGDFVRGDVYNNVVTSFERVPVAALYVIANVALAFHIYHGAWSLFQTLGWNRPRFNAWRRSFAVGLAAVILVGNVSFPLMVQAGLIDQDERTTPPPSEMDHEQEARQ